jgi:hypothetical protein
MSVPEDDLSVAGGDAKVFEQGRGGVADRVQADLADAVVVADAAERPDEVTRSIGRPVLVAGIGPGRAEHGAVCLLAVPASSKGRAGEPEQREITGTGPRLHWTDVQFASDTLDLLPDVDHLATKVDVLPAQAEHFPSAHPVQQQENEGREQRVVGGGIEEGKGAPSARRA